MRSIIPKLVTSLIVLGALCTTAMAKARENSFPAELMFQGKPIDPKCIYNIAWHAKVKDIELKKSCSSLEWEQNEEGTPLKHSNLIIDDDGAGYDYTFDGGRTGELNYRYLGSTVEGLVLEMNYSGGGSGHFTTLGIYNRQGNHLRKIRMIDSGDRCSHGLIRADVLNGHLIYEYYVTPLELYQTYTHDSSNDTGLADGFINCGAIVSTRDGKISSVELKEDTADYYPGCFQTAYASQFKARQTMTDIEAKQFILKFVSLCPLKPKSNSRIRTHRRLP